MTDGIKLEFKISGVPQLLRRMRSLPEKLQKRALKKAVRAGAVKIRDEARRLASNFDDPATLESIEANIDVQFASRMSRSGQVVAYRVGVRGGAKEGAHEGGGPAGGDTWYWRLLEFGTSKMRAQPFLRPAAESQAEAAAEKVATVLAKELDRLVKEP